MLKTLDIYVHEKHPKHQNYYSYLFSQQISKFPYSLCLLGSNVTYQFSGAEVKLPLTLQKCPLIMRKDFARFLLRPLERFLQISFLWLFVVGKKMLISNLIFIITMGT